MSAPHSRRRFIPLERPRGHARIVDKVLPGFSAVLILCIFSPTHKPSVGTDVEILSSYPDPISSGAALTWILHGVVAVAFK